MGVDEALAVFDAFIRRCRSSRKNRYDLLDLRSPDGVVLGEHGRFLRQPDDGGPPSWGFDVAQVERMRGVIRDAVRDALRPDPEGDTP